MSRIDHVAIAVQDLDAAAQSLNEVHGLCGYAGGRTAGVGIENHIIPIGDGYIELISLCNEQEAAGNPLGRVVLERITDAKASLLLWAVEPEHGVQHVADQLDLSISSLRRSLPDGGDCAFKLAGLQPVLESQQFPLFIEWNDQSARPDKRDTVHRCHPVGFGLVEVSGDISKLDSWLAAVPLSVPVETVEGDPQLKAFTVLTESGSPICFREPLTFLSEQATVKAANHMQQIESTDGGSAASQSEVTGSQPSEAPVNHEGGSVFESVLQNVEQALESAADYVEALAGDHLSPVSGNVKPAS